MVQRGGDSFRVDTELVYQYGIPYRYLKLSYIEFAVLDLL